MRKSESQSLTFSMSSACRLLFLSGFLVAAMPQHEVFATVPTVGPNVNLTQAAGNQYETAVAIDPRDNDRIFVVSRNEIGGLYAARTVDGGASWIRDLIATSNPAPPGNVPRAYGNASVAWDEFGNLFLAYLAQGSKTAPLFVALAVSTDGGATFYSPTGGGPAIVLPNPTLQGDQPTVAVGPGSGGYPGSVWVTYFSFGGVWVSGAGVSGLGVVGPFASQLLPGQPTSVSFGDVAVGPNGEVMVTYGPDFGGWGSYWIYTQFDADGLGPAPFTDARQAVETRVGGFLSIPAQPHWGVDPEAGLAFDRTTGRVCLLYTDTDPVDASDTNIFVVHSDDRGSTWSAPVRVNDDAGSKSQFLPRIALDQSSGVIAATWYDARNSANNDTAQYFGAISTDGGASFGANFQISAGTSDQAMSSPAPGWGDADYGDYTGVAIANGRLVPAWADNSNSTGDNPDGATQFDVYAAVVEVSQPSDVTPPVITVTANPATLSPPNGHMAEVTVSGTMSDDLSGINPSTPAFVVHDEYGSIQPHGPVAVGEDGTYSFSILLEARRYGDDVDGRGYAIIVTAQDGAGNTGSAGAAVVVPHDRGP